MTCQVNIKQKSELNSHFLVYVLTVNTEFCFQKEACYADSHSHPHGQSAQHAGAAGAHLQPPRPGVCQESGSRLQVGVEWNISGQFPIPFYILKYKAFLKVKVGAQNAQEKRTE